MDKFIFYAVFLLAASASVKSQYNTCGKNLEFCMFDSECCTNYCEYALGEDTSSGLCTEWPFPNCGRDGDDCLHHTDCCHGFCAHEENKYATFNYCTNGPAPSLNPPIAFAPLPVSPAPSPELISDVSGSAPVPVATPEASDFSPPSPPAPEISPYFGIAPGPSADSSAPEIPPSSIISPDASPITTTTPPPTPCNENREKHRRSRKWKHGKGPKAPAPGSWF